MRRAIPLLFFILISASVLAQSSQPNIVMIVVDDMRYDEWGGGGHPYLQTPNIDLLGEEGTQFNRAYHAVPLCSPNRASILTGQYPSRHGIIDNTARNQASFMLDLFPKYLQEAGYKTAHVGKWHMGNSPEPRPGYDYWVCMEGQGRTYNPVLFEDNTSYVAEGYITDVFTDKAIGFIQENADAPFFLYIGHKAIHPEAVQRDDGSTDLDVPKEFIPANRHKGLYLGKTYQRSPSYSPTASVEEGKPVIENAFRLRSEALEKDPRWAGSMDLGIAEKTIQTRAEMMLAVDESLGRIMAELQKLGIDENTVIIFTSDNGYFFGEHGFSLERRMPYEESVRAPLLIRHPGIRSPVKAVDGLALSVDLAATALDIAGVNTVGTVQGKSLMPLLSGENDTIRSSGLIEYYSNENPFPWTAQLDYRVVVTDQFKYIKWLRFDRAELYDLKKDPYELQNLIEDPAYKEILGDLQGQLRVLQLEALALE
ncbi:MAG: sulfatase-like hydrolase/transferase [Robiginitalea sp.]|uniref:sulfatase-like hydrolase/transferase n=1 Tax=Robiginitalea sp. TaxID=1902411 RepID=UPI003C74EE34